MRLKKGLKLPNGYTIDHVNAGAVYYKEGGKGYEINVKKLVKQEKDILKIALKIGAEELFNVLNAARQSSGEKITAVKYMSDSKFDNPGEWITKKVNDWMKNAIDFIEEKKIVEENNERLKERMKKYEM